MFMKPIVETEIIQIISKFKQNKSAGHDDIGNLIIKKSGQGNSFTSNHYLQ